MTYTEAVDYKNTIGDIMIYEGDEWIVKIVPTTPDDFIKYGAEFLKRDISDQEAKNFSHNGDFMVYRFRKSAYDLKHHPL